MDTHNVLILLLLHLSPSNSVSLCFKKRLILRGDEEEAGKQVKCRCFKLISRKS